MRTPSFASLPMLVLAASFAALTQCFSQVPAAPKFTKVEQIITSLPAGVLPQGKWDALELSKVSEAVAAVTVGQSAEFSVKLLRLEEGVPHAQNLRFSAVRDEFKARGRNYVTTMVCTLAKGKEGKLVAAKQNGTLKVRGSVSRLMMSGVSDSLVLWIELRDCELL